VLLFGERHAELGERPAGCAAVPFVRVLCRPEKPIHSIMVRTDRMAREGGRER